MSAKHVTTSPWVGCPNPNPAANLRLFCFPYGGGGTFFYHSWSRELPKTVEVCVVQIPGRENRLKEKPYDQMRPLIQAIAEALVPFFAKPFVFFGHSLGALLGFEVARYIRKHYGCEPSHLFVSGHRGPQYPSFLPLFHTLPDQEFMEAIRNLNGTPEEVWQYPELVQMMLPTLRADFTMWETYAYLPEAPLNCPISAFGGEHDPMATPREIEGWREQTTAPFFFHIFPGDHFFIHTAKSLVLEYLSQKLNHARSPDGPMVDETSERDSLPTRSRDTGGGFDVFRKTSSIN